MAIIIGEQSAPATPATAKAEIYLTAGSPGTISVKHEDGSTVNLEAGAGGGETNTASSAGVGTSLFYTKTGVDLEFNAIKSENALLTVALDGTSHDVELTVNEASIDHDALTNYVAAEHVDWAGAGAGTIHTDNYIEGGPGTDTTAIHDNVASEISAITLKATPVSGDFILIEDSAAANVKKYITVGSLPAGSEVNDLTAAVTWANVPDANVTQSSVTQHVGAIDHDATLNFVAAEHVDWAGAGAGTIHTDNYIEGGAGTDTTAIHDNVAAEISAITEKVSPVGADVLLIEDSAAGNVKKRIQITNLPAGGEINDLSAAVTWANVPDANITQSSVTQHVGAIDHDSLLNYVAAEHVDWAGAGAGTIHTDNYIEGGPGTDTTAIHDDTASEISAVTLKATPISGDFLLIEDSAAANVKKRVTIGSLPAGSEVNDLTAAVTWANVPDANITQGSVTQHVGAIDHDSLLNFVADEHLDWTADLGATNINNANITGLLHGTEVDDPSTGVHGVSGTVVGTSDSQTLTNKTYDTPTLDGIITLAGTNGVQRTGNNLTLDLTDAATKTFFIVNSTASQQCDVDIDGVVRFRNNTGFWFGLSGTPTANRVMTIPDVASDTFVMLGATQTLTGKTLTTPTIASFANAAHDHEDAAGGAQLTDAALSAAVGVAKGGTGLTAGTSGGILGYTATGTLASSALLAASQLVIGGGAGVTPSTLAAGTNNFILRMGASNPGWEAETLTKSITIESPTTADDVTMFFTPVAITITQSRIAIVGSATPSWTVDVKHHTSRNNAGNALITSPTASTEAGNSAESTGHNITSFDDATIPANSWVWVETDAIGGTLDQGAITLRYTID